MFTLVSDANALFGDFGGRVSTCGFNATIRWETGPSRRRGRVPILVLLGLLASGRVDAGRSALAGLVTASVVALFVFGMPARMILAGAAVGVVFAIFRIVWLILAAVFLYDIAVTTGQFDGHEGLDRPPLGRSEAPGGAGGLFVRGLHRGGRGFWGSGGDLGGLPGGPGLPALPGRLALPDRQYGTGRLGRHRHAVADPQRGDRPGVEALSATSGRILPLLSVLIPFWLVRTMTGWRETMAVWIPLLTIGGTFAAVQFFWSNFVGFELVDIVASVSSMVAGVLVLRAWKPRRIWRFDDEARSLT